MDITSRDELFAAIRATGESNSQLHAVCVAIATQAKRMDKEIGKQTNEKEKRKGLNQLTADSSDDELRAGVRLLLIAKVNDNSLTASEIGQFKDVFGLADASSDLVIETVDYANACTCDVPHVCPEIGGEA